MVAPDNFTFDQYETAMKEANMPDGFGHSKKYWDSLTVARRHEIILGLVSLGATLHLREDDSYDTYLMARRDALADPRDDYMPEQWTGESDTRRKWIMGSLRRKAAAIEQEARALELSGWGSW